MAQEKFTLDLQDTFFPLLSRDQTRTVINPPSGQRPAPPSIAYCHNVMPIKEGYISVQNTELIPAVMDIVDLFVDVRQIFGDKRTRIYLAWDDTGRMYRLLPTSTEWLKIADTVPSSVSPGFDANAIVTNAHVNGITYLFFNSIATAFTYDEDTDTLEEVVFIGLVLSALLGIVGNAGYLVAYTAGDIAWSSTINPLDFTPSQITGAGGGSVAEIEGAILFCTHMPLGYLIYAEANVVSATYTANVQFPWKFKEVAGSKGGISTDLLAHDANSKEDFVYTKGGLQQISTQKAEVILPEITDFLAGQVFENFNTSTLLYEYTNLTTAPMRKKVRFIAARYLVLSYGVTEFTDALVFDLALEKLGKIKHTHVDVFEYTSALYPDGLQIEVAKETLAFLEADGRVTFVNFTETTGNPSVLILGKLEHTRRRLVTTEGLEVENAKLGLTVYDQVSIDGKNVSSTVQGTLAPASLGELDIFRFHVTGKNHSFIFLGDFKLVTAEVTYHQAGKR